MLPVLGILTATLGLYAILFLILREVREEIGPTERGALLAGGVLVTVTAIWQVIAQWPGAGAH